MIKKILILFFLLTVFSYGQQNIPVSPYAKTDTAKTNPSYFWKVKGIIYPNGSIGTTAGGSGSYDSTDLHNLRLFILAMQGDTAALQNLRAIVNGKLTASDTTKIRDYSNILYWLANDTTLIHNLRVSKLDSHGKSDSTAVSDSLKNFNKSLYQLFGKIGLRQYDSTGLSLGKFLFFDGTSWVLKDTSIVKGGGGGTGDSARVAYHADIADAIDYSTLEFFPWLWNKLYDLKQERDSVRMDSTVHTHTQIRIAKFGDSIGGRKGMYIIPILQSAYGNLGTQATGTCAGGAILKGVSNPADRIYSIAPGGFYYVLPSGGNIAFGTAAGNIFKVMYLAEPGAGSFKIQVSAGNAGSYIDEAGYEDISADSTTRSLQVITIRKDSTNIWHIKLVGLTDTVRTLDTYMTTDLLSGVEDIMWAGNGMALTNWMDCDTSILRVYLQTIKPDLIFMEWLDPVEGWKSALDSCFSRFLSAYHSEFVCIGTNPIAVGDSDVIMSNAILRTESKKYDQFFWNSYPTVKSHDKMVALGWATGDVHPMARNDTYQASLLMHDMKIFNNIYEVTTKEIKVDYVTALKGIDIGSTSTANLAWLRPNGLGLDIETGGYFTFKNFTGTKYLGRDANNLFTGGTYGAMRIGEAFPGPYLWSCGGTDMYVMTDAAGNGYASLTANKFRTDGANNGLYWYWPDGYGQYRTNITDTLTIDFGSIGAGGDSVRTINLLYAIAGNPVLVGMDSDLEPGLDIRAVCITNGQVILHLYNKTLTPIDPAPHKFKFTAVNK